MSVGFFDIETLKTADEVGGWEYAHEMGFACACLYIDDERAYKVYVGGDVRREGSACYPGVNDTEDFLLDLLELDLIVGFNLTGFDYKVLQPYATPLGIQLNTLPTFDILEELGRTMNKRYPASLESLGTLNIGNYGRKLDDASSVIANYRAGMIDEVILYCIHDVWVTRMLFQCAYIDGRLAVRGSRGVRLTVDTRGWRDVIKKKLKRDILQW